MIDYLNNRSFGDIAIFLMGLQLIWPYGFYCYDIELAAKDAVVQAQIEEVEQNSS